MSACRRSLISELEDAIQSGSKAERIDTLRRITDLFLSTSERLNADQVAVFDEVLGLLIERMEARALAELSGRLAPIENAPIGVVRSLASSDEIAVAGPILSLSTRLTNADLLEIASTKGKAHLLAISNRSALDVSVTDALVRRGDIQVRRTLAARQDARFSDESMSHLIKCAESDDLLTEKLGLRLDLPLHLSHQLLSRASDAVREKLLRVAPASHRDEIRSILSDLGGKVLDELPDVPDFEQAADTVRRMKEDGELNEITFLQLVRSNRYAEWVAALAEMCATPYDILDCIFKSNRSEAVIVPYRAGRPASPGRRCAHLCSPGR